jgi:hypothetical protein
MQAKQLELHMPGIEDNFPTVTDALYECHVVEHRRVETICEDAY